MSDTPITPSAASANSPDVFKYDNLSHQAPNRRLSITIGELLELQIEMLLQRYGWHGIALFRLESKDSDAIGSAITEQSSEDSFMRKIAGAAMPDLWPAIMAAHGISGVSVETLAAEMRQAYMAESREGFYCWPNLTEAEKAPWLAAAHRALNLIDRIHQDVDSCLDTTATRSAQ